MQVNSSACLGITRNRELLVGQVGAGKLKTLRDVVRVQVDRRRRLVHPAGLQLLQAVLAQVVIGLARAVVVGSHCGDPSPSIGGALLLRGCNAPAASVVPDSGGEFCHVRGPRARSAAADARVSRRDGFRPLVNLAYPASIPRCIQIACRPVSGSVRAKVPPGARLKSGHIERTVAPPDASTLHSHGACVIHRAPRPVRPARRAAGRTARGPPRRSSTVLGGPPLESPTTAPASAAISAPAA